MSAGLALFGALSCPVMDCTMCLKDGVSFTDPDYLDTMASKWNQGECAGRCNKIVHCKDEALCLVGSSGAEGGSCFPPVTPFASCQSTTYSTTPKPSQSCGEQCIKFDLSCAKSCSPEQSCGTVEMKESSAGKKCAGSACAADLDAACTLPLKKVDISSSSSTDVALTQCSLAVYAHVQCSKTFQYSTALGTSGGCECLVKGQTCTLEDASGWTTYEVDEKTTVSSSTTSNSRATIWATLVAALAFFFKGKA